MVLPKGPSHAKVIEGDVLLKVNSKNIILLSRFEDLIDNTIRDRIKV